VGLIESSDPEAFEDANGGTLSRGQDPGHEDPRYVPDEAIIKGYSVQPANIQGSLRGIQGQSPGRLRPLGQFGESQGPRP
jgi:hypothetical protein